MRNSTTVVRPLLEKVTPMFQLYPTRPDRPVLTGLLLDTSGHHQARLSQHAADRYAVLQALSELKSDGKTPSVRGRRVRS